MKMPQNLRDAFARLDTPACLGVLVNDITAMVVKADQSDIQIWRGANRPIGTRFVLGKQDAGAVIAWWATIYEPGGARFELETVLNVASEIDRPLLQSLTEQKVLHFHFFTPDLEYAFSKEVRHRSRQRDQVKRFIMLAMRHNERLRGEHNWQQAVRQFFEASQERD